MVISHGNIGATDDDARTSGNRTGMRAVVFAVKICGGDSTTA